MTTFYQVEHDSRIVTAPAEWLAEQFEYELCAECGRGADAHSVELPFGFARCHHEPEFDSAGQLICHH